MQIIDKGGKVTVKLDQAEGRRLRDASYILSRIARNIPQREHMSNEQLLALYKLAEDGDQQATDVLLENLTTPQVLGVTHRLLKRIADTYTPERLQEKLDRQDGE